MNYIFMLQVQQSLQNLLHYSSNITFTQVIADQYLFEQLTTLTQLKHQHIIWLVIVNLE